MRLILAAFVLGLSLCTFSLPSDSFYFTSSVTVLNTQLDAEKVEYYNLTSNQVIQKFTLVAGSGNLQSMNQYIDLGKGLIYVASEDEYNPYCYKYEMEPSNLAEYFKEM